MARGRKKVGGPGRGPESCVSSPESPPESPESPPENPENHPEEEETVDITTQKTQKTQKQKDHSPEQSVGVGVISPPVISPSQALDNQQRKHTNTGSTQTQTTPPPQVVSPPPQSQVSSSQVSSGQLQLSQHDIANYIDEIATLRRDYDNRVQRCLELREELDKALTSVEDYDVLVVENRLLEEKIAENKEKAEKYEDVSDTLLQLEERVAFQNFRIQTYCVGKKQVPSEVIASALSEKVHEASQLSEENRNLRSDLWKCLKFMCEINIEAGGGPRRDLVKKDILPEDVVNHLRLSDPGTHLQSRLLDDLIRENAELFGGEVGGEGGVDNNNKTPEGVRSILLSSGGDKKGEPPSSSSLRDFTSFLLKPKGGGGNFGDAGGIFQTTSIMSNLTEEEGDVMVEGKKEGNKDKDYSGDDDSVVAVRRASESGESSAESVEIKIIEDSGIESLLGSGIGEGNSSAGSSGLKEGNDDVAQTTLTNHLEDSYFAAPATPEGKVFDQKRGDDS